MNLPGITITRERVNPGRCPGAREPTGHTLSSLCPRRGSAEWRINAVRRGIDVISLYRGRYGKLPPWPPDHSDVLIVAVETRQPGGLAAHDIPPARSAVGSAQTEATKQWLATMLAIYGTNDAPPELDAVLPALVLDRMHAMLKHFMLHGDAACCAREPLMRSYRQAWCGWSRIRIASRFRLPIWRWNSTSRRRACARAFMETVGITPSAWLRQHRLDGARRDLNRTDGSVSRSR